MEQQREFIENCISLKNTKSEIQQVVWELVALPQKCDMEASDQVPKIAKESQGPQLEENRGEPTNAPAWPLAPSFGFLFFSEVGGRRWRS